VYNSYSGRIYDHAQYPIRTLKQGSTKACVLAGPTCDSIDVIEENILLPELEIGDLLVGEVMGAYTAATATEFNSLPKSKIVVLNENSMANHSLLHVA
jgi:ornithine decarboxylase